MAPYVIATILLALGVGAAAAALYARELGRFETFLRNRPLSSNVQLTVGTHLPGCTGLAQAVNAHMHASSQRELKMRQDEEDLLEGLAGLSHDIRTPLAGAKGYLQLAADETDTTERTQCLHQAERRLDAMQVLLDQLFDYTRTLGTSAPLDLDDVDAFALLSSVLAGRHPEFSQRGWEVHLEGKDGPMPVQADEAALRRVFENVVSNTLRHGAGDVRIRVEGSAMTFSNALAAGDAPDADAVFDRFYRSDAARSETGAGLGLSVVRELCTAMGMQAAAAVEDGRFVIVLSFPQAARQVS